MAGGLFILVTHASYSGAFLIISSAFSGQAAVGGFAGSTVMLAIQWVFQEVCFQMKQVLHFIYCSSVAKT